MQQRKFACRLKQQRLLIKSLQERTKCANEGWKATFSMRHAHGKYGIYVQCVHILYYLHFIYKFSDGTNSCHGGISNLQNKIQIHFFSTEAPYKCLNLNAIFCQYNIRSILDIWFLLCLIGGTWTKHICFYDRYFQVQCEFSKFFFFL